MSRDQTKLTDDLPASIDYLMRDVDGYVADDAHRRRAIPILIRDYADDHRTFLAQQQELEEVRGALAALEAERDRLRSRLSDVESGAEAARAKAADLRARLDGRTTIANERLVRHAEAADRARQAAERRAADADGRAQQAEQRAAATERRIPDAERRAREAEQAADAARHDARLLLRALDGALAPIARARRRNWILAHLLDRILARLERRPEPSGNHDRIRERTENALRTNGVDLPPADKPPKFPMPSRDSFLEAARTRLARH